MFNSSRLFQCAAFTALFGCFGLTQIAGAIASSRSSSETNSSSIEPSISVDLGQQYDSRPYIIGQSSSNDQVEETVEIDWDERRGEPGGSRLEPELEWGEPGGSRIVSEMADDLLEFFTWGEPGGSRGSGICPITPYSFRLEDVREGPFMWWSDRPLIVWQGNVSQILIHRFIDNEKMWSHPVNPTDTSVRYAGKELQPGELYTLTFVGVPPEGASVGSPTDGFLFELLGADERQRVEAELSQWEAQVSASGATAEELALRRSRFFIQHDLRLLYDSLDALFSVDNPSPELAQRLDQIRTVLCEGPTE